MALNRIQHIKPVIRALNALHRETYVEASVLLVAGFMYLHDRQIYLLISLGIWQKLNSLKTKQKWGLTPR